MKANGIWVKCSGKNENIEFSGDKVTLEEMQKCVGGYIEPIYIGGNKIMFVNEEGKINGLEMNVAATNFLRSHGIPHVIVGDVLVIDSKFVD